METDRPDQTESPFITKYRFFQIEVGLGVGREEGYSTLVVPTILWKYGLLKKLELRLITEINAVHVPPIVPNGNEINTGLMPVQIGGKLSLFEEKNFLPKTSLIFHLGIPKAATRKFQASKWSPAFVLTMQNTVSEAIGVGYNVGTEWDGETDTPYWIYTISPGFNIGRRWYSFIELFGAARKNESPQNSIDGGVGYYINDNVKLDASGGLGISKAAVDYFFGAGFSFRIH